MRVLLAIPHVYAPRDGSRYSSQRPEKREKKQAALRECVLSNLDRLQKRHWVHASLGLRKPVVNRVCETSLGVDLTVQVFSPPQCNLLHGLGDLPENVTVIDPEQPDLMQVPLTASRRLIEQSADYDMVGFMEDDLAIRDPEFFQKIQYLVERSGGGYVFLPHRCETIPGHGDVILSGDPDGGRPDLFWDTGEIIEVEWPLGGRRFYRATNPHSGCYFLTRSQAQRVLEHWSKQNWIFDFQLSGPLEQAGSGILLPLLKVMKPIPEHYRFLMVHHQDELWKNHPFERSV